MNNSSNRSDEHSFLIDSVQLNNLKGQTVLIKYGGNAMIDDKAANHVFDQIAALYRYGIKPIIVHGGGPFIRKLLSNAGIKSVFIEGHRKTDEQMLEYVEMALNGKVNGMIVKQLNIRGLHAVGLSGKDAAMVRARRRYHISKKNREEIKTDIGFVGDVESVEPKLITLLLGQGYLPVIAPLGVGSDGQDYNINADMFAGHIAGALGCRAFIALTDVDGLMEDPKEPRSKIEKINSTQIKNGIGKTILGGMIPKVESSLIALRNGVQRAHIINGMKPDTLLRELLSNERSGTCIVS